MSADLKGSTPYEYAAQVTRVIDGDTVECSITKSHTVDFGFKFKQRVTGEFELRLRLYGLDTPEISGVKKTSQEYKDGMDAKMFVITWLDRHCDKSVGGHWKVHLKTHDGKRLDAHKGKYHGRWVAEVWNREQTLSLNEALIEAGLDKLTRDAKAEEE